MATCDALELEVQNSTTETEKLMQSVLKEAFSDSDTSKSETKTSKASKAFQRSVLAAYLVDNSLEDRYFGHVKLQKMLFMCEAVNSLDFDSNYKRHAMGPYDPKLIRSVDTQLKRNKWFECKKWMVIREDMFIRLWKKVMNIKSIWTDISNLKI